jgi:hypothetical protein
MGKTDHAVTSSNHTHTEYWFIIMRLKWEIKPGVFSEIIIVMQKVLFFDVFAIFVEPEEEVVIVVVGVVEMGGNEGAVLD